MHTSVRRSIALVSSAVLLAGLVAGCARSNVAPVEGGRAEAPAKVSSASLKGKLPEDRAECVAAFLNMFSDPQPQRVRAFEMDHRSVKSLMEIGPDDRVERDQRLAQQVGKLTLREVLSSTADMMSITCTNAQGKAVRVDFTFDAEQRDKVDEIRLVQ